MLSGHGVDMVCTVIFFKAMSSKRLTSRAFFFFFYGAGLVQNGQHFKG